MGTLKLSAQGVGFEAAVPAVSTAALGAAATRLAMSFIADGARTLSKIKFYVSAVAGTLGANDIVVELQADSGGVPSNVAIESRNTVTATPTGPGWVEVTGFTTTLTDGQLYHAVVRNANASPATNNFTVRTVTGLPSPPTTTGGGYAWGRRTSTDSGSSYGTRTPGLASLRIEYADGQFDGMPAENGATNTVQTVYGTREVGAYFVSPANVRLPIRGLSFHCGRAAGAPSGDLRYRLYTGAVPALQRTSHAIPVAQIVTTHNYVQAVFSSPYILEPGTIVRAVMSETAQSDPSSNAYRMTEWTIEDNAQSKALGVFSGTWKRTYFDGSSWVETDAAWPFASLILDSDGEFAAVAGGGSPIYVMGDY